METIDKHDLELLILLFYLLSVGHRCASPCPVFYVTGDGTQVCIDAKQQTAAISNSQTFFLFLKLGRILGAGGAWVFLPKDDNKMHRNH